MRKSLDRWSRALVGSWWMGFACVACVGPGGSLAADRSGVDAVLDGFHAAASRADGPAFFAAFDPQGVFIGTDATEHWSVAQFRDYAEPHFSTGHGWTYHPRDRRVAFSSRSDVAWFEERLDNDKYGEIRGSGVLVYASGVWRIAQYVMSFPIPNERTAAILELMRSSEASGS